VLARHTAKAFDADLQELVRSIGEMGRLAERQIIEAIESLSTRDGGRARRLVAADDVIDAMQRVIEEKAVATIARRQPVANDLWQLIGALRIANELERVGDLAKNIGKRIMTFSGAEPPGPLAPAPARRQPSRQPENAPRDVVTGPDRSGPSPLHEVGRMATLLLDQFRDVLDSFANRDLAKAIEVWTRDQEVDRLCTTLFRELLAHMMDKPADVTFGIHLLFCTKNLERIGDHATNIAEAVHYMVAGQMLACERPKADATSALRVTTLACEGFAPNVRRSVRIDPASPKTNQYRVVE
jgi:phosphate transport system protein